MTVLVIKTSHTCRDAKGVIMQPQATSVGAPDALLDQPDVSPFTISVTCHRDTNVLSVDGDLDMMTAPLLTAAVDAALDESWRLIIDLTHTAFLSSAGMRVLLVANETIGSTGGLAVVAHGPTTERPMKLVGLDTTLTIVPTLAEAIAALTGPANHCLQAEEA